MRTSFCCAMAVTKGVTLTVTNPRSPAFPKETGTVQPAFQRYVTVNSIIRLISFSFEF